jgi:hypothetical protein
MAAAVAATQETPMKRGETRSPRGHAACAITMKNNTGTMKKQCRHACRLRDGRTKKPGAVYPPGRLMLLDAQL